MGTRSLLVRFRETDRYARRFLVGAGTVLFVLFLLQQVFTFLGYATARNLSTAALAAFGAGFGIFGFARMRRETEQFEQELERTIADTATRIATTARALTEVSAKIEASATQLAGTSQVQTGSVQQSLDTMSHISKAFEQTATLAGEGHELGRQGLEEGFKGLDIIDRMIGAVEQLRESHQSLQSIVTLISTIREKTQIINDIVFETRLLSFNASIEAARAGESGKGFAVVAEHVGKLAEMSGQAALEINELLNSATTEVAQVVKVTRERVEVGAKVTIESQGAFEAVNSAIMRISSNLEKIGQSARDQHDKVKGAVESMNGVSGLSLDHLESARELSESSNKLVQESLEFLDSVSGLKSLVELEAA